MSKIAELRSKSKEELNDLVLSLKKEQFNLRFQAATGALENRNRFKEVRRTIARAKTLINELANPNAKVVVKSEKPKKAKAAKAPKAETAEKAKPKAKAAKKKDKE